MSVSLSLLYIGNIATTWALLLLIWLVQVIIYPGLSRVPSKDFANYHRWYVTRISVLVVPLMICEAITTLGWLMLEPDSYYSTIAAFLVVIIWLATFMLQVPIHRHLQSGKDNARIRRLVDTNWIRTMAWTAKAVIVTLSAVNRI